MIKHIKTGVATSIFKNQNFDSFLTLEYATKQKLSLVQLYLNKDLENNPDLIDAICKKTTDYSIELLCHSPFYLNNEILLAERHLNLLHTVFPKNQRKLVVVHFDERISVPEALRIIENLNRKDLTVCLENYHIEKTAASLAHNINSFNLLFEGVFHRNLDCIPVFDFPRLFLEPFTSYNPLFLSQMILDTLARGNNELFLHMIDFIDTRQESAHWCPIGSGIMPWESIFSLIKTYQITVAGVILELEDVLLTTESLQPLAKLVSLL